MAPSPASDEETAGGSPAPGPGVLPPTPGLHTIGPAALPVSTGLVGVGQNRGHGQRLKRPPRALPWMVTILCPRWGGQRRSRVERGWPGRPSFALPGWELGWDPFQER